MFYDIILLVVKVGFNPLHNFTYYKLEEFIDSCCEQTDYKVLHVFTPFMVCNRRGSWLDPLFLYTLNCVLSEDCTDTIADDFFFFGQHFSWLVGSFIIAFVEISFEGS